MRFYKSMKSQRKTVEEYLTELHEMYGVKYELVRVDVPHRIARKATVTLRCPIHGLDTKSRLNNFLAYRYGQYTIDTPSNVKHGRSGAQTVCTFPCSRCRELKLSPVQPDILSDAGKAQRVSNYLFSYSRRQYSVKHVGGHIYEIKCAVHDVVNQRTRTDIKSSPDRVCLGCYIDIHFTEALGVVVKRLGRSNFQYEVLNYPTKSTEIHVLSDGSRYNVLELLRK